VELWYTTIEVSCTPRVLVLHFNCDAHREGNKVPKKEPGYVVFVLKPLPHKRFIRRGADLVHKLTLPLYQALIGTSVDVQTLDHRYVQDMHMHAVPSKQAVVACQVLVASYHMSHMWWFPEHQYMLPCRRNASTVQTLHTWSQSIPHLAWSSAATSFASFFITPTRAQRTLSQQMGGRFLAARTC